MQGRAALHDLAASPVVGAITAADREIVALEQYVAARGFGERVRCRHVDAAQPKALDRLVAEGCDVVVDLLPAAAGNPLRYKVSWTLEGVLRSYRRGARLIRDGAVVRVGPAGQFLPENVHEVEVAGVGPLEAYPNGDALHFLEPLGLDTTRLRNAGRFTLRYPGHCRFWRTMVALHLLDDEPVEVDGAEVDRKRFLAAALEPHLRYGEGERDLGILRLEVTGTENGRRQRVVFDVLDRKDLATGLSAMSRLVGFTASIGAQLIGTGQLTKRGLLSPVTDGPWAPLALELERRGITVTRTVS
jgi:saccharopine dehydrogenase-like NADP-dependent oxidoreductase